MKKTLDNCKLKPGVLVRYSVRIAMKGATGDVDRYGICVSEPFESVHGNVYLIDVWWFDQKPYVINKKRGPVGITNLSPWPWDDSFSPYFLPQNLD